MGMFEMSEEQIATYRGQMRTLAEEKVSEPVVAAAMVRRGGAGGKMAVSHAGLGGLVYGAIALFQKKQAGGLPDKALLVATPTKLHAYKAKVKGRGFQAGDEVAVWEGQRHRGPRERVTIHRQRGGRYWYYWVLLIGGTIFVIAALASDMFGLGSY